MLTKPVLTILLAACGVGSSGSTTEPPTEQPDKRPPDQPPEEEGQHFCCVSVNKKTVSGDGCGAISKENINSCTNVLYCSGDWVKEGDQVSCV
jgi:hypothetical protein